VRANKPAAINMKNDLRMLFYFNRNRFYNRSFKLRPGKKVASHDEKGL